MSARGDCCADTKLEASSDQKQAVSGSTRRSKLARSCEVTEILYHSEGGSHIMTASVCSQGPRRLKSEIRLL